jgi:tetratricopeptide (TPR) repeat protein
MSTAMRVTVALLADSAVAVPGGKFDLLGAGVDSIAFPSFPALLPSLSLVLKLRFRPEEAAQERVVEVRSLDSERKPFQAPFTISLRPASADGGPLHFVYNMRDVTFPAPGEYGFAVAIDGLEAAVIPLFVYSVIPTGDHLSPDPLATGLQEGFNAFGRGQSDAALAIFEDLIEKFPASPHAQNNRGFVLLGLGRPDDALNSFNAALEMGYPLTEITRANIATAHYLQGRYPEAVAGFQSLLATQPHAPFSVLFAIERDTLRPIKIVGAGDLVALASLNGARSAIAAGQAGVARDLAAAARAGLFAFTESEDSRDQFRQLLTALAADLGTTLGTD